MFIRRALLLVVLFSAILELYGQNLGNDVIDGVDVLGSIVNMIDRAMTRFSFRNLKPNERSCASRLIKLSNQEIKISGQPRGACPYCCPIIHPKKYVRLYFTNIRLKGRMVELKLINKVGLLRAAGVKSNLTTVIYFHGFTEHGLGPLSSKIRDAYLSRPEEHNIILVDWGELSPFPWYQQAAKSTKLVAQVLTEFIMYYHDSGELPISQIHLIGFSLGAHVAGFVGKGLKVRQKVPRLTALDPARPSFSIPDATQRVSKDDAEYVDVIHTDGGKFGMYMAVGHADFYPNGGIDMQPGCTTSYLAENRTIESYVSCSHLRAVDFYAESVAYPTAFPAFKCSPHLKSKRCKRNKTAYMGFIANKSPWHLTMYHASNYFEKTRWSSCAMTQNCNGVVHYLRKGVFVVVTYCHRRNVILPKEYRLHSIESCDPMIRCYVHTIDNLNTI